MYMVAIESFDPNSVKEATPSSQNPSVSGEGETVQQTPVVRSESEEKTAPLLSDEEMEELYKKEPDDYMRGQL